MTLFQHVNKDKGITVIVVTHWHGHRGVGRQDRHLPRRIDHRGSSIEG
jgi:ABC-type lipoprotein export system ATPase subunit